MDFIQNILTAVTGFFSGSSWTELMAIVALWLVAFERLAQWTPTDKDNKVVEWLYKIFSVLGLKKPE